MRKFVTYKALKGSNTLTRFPPTSDHEEAYKLASESTAGPDAIFRVFELDTSTNSERYHGAWVVQAGVVRHHPDVTYPEGF